MDYSEILITDGSALWDFAGCGEDCDDYPQGLNAGRLPRDEMHRIWDKRVMKKIQAKYGIDAPDCDRLFRLFRQIKAVQNQRIH